MSWARVWLRIKRFRGSGGGDNRSRGAGRGGEESSPEAGLGEGLAEKEG